MADPEIDMFNGPDGSIQYETPRYQRLGMNGRAHVQFARRFCIVSSI